MTGLWLAADILDRRPGQLTVQYRGYFGGIPLESVQRITLAAPHRVEFHQTRGGLRSLEGQYLLQPVDGETELTILLDADISMPLISDAAAARVLRAHAEQTLEKIKLVAERELPRVVRRAAREKPAAADEVEPTAEAVVAAEEDIEEPTEAAETLESTTAAEPAAGSEPTVPPRAMRKRRRRRRRRGGKTSSQSSPSSASEGSHGGETGKTG